MPIRVLYVDDEADNLFSFRSMFRRLFQVETASSGDEALSLLSEGEYDVVLSDQRMPNMTGIELCGQIREHFPGVRRHIVTAYGDMDALKEAIRDGVIAGVIKKPWDMEELRTVVEGGFKG